MGSISLITWKLCAFLQRSNFDNFQQFFHDNFPVKLNFFFQIISSEISSSNLSEHILLQIIRIFRYLKNQFLGEKLTIVDVVFFEIFPELSDFAKSDD